MKIDDKGTTSFRQWNPEKIDTPWDEDNGSYTEADAKEDEGPGGCYYICGCVAKCFKYGFQEVVNVM